MHRQSLNGDGKNRRDCKVRKRGGSSSSSSSLVRSYRLKRAVLVGKRGGSSTPVPMWKMMDNVASRSPMSQNNGNLEGTFGDKGKDSSVSARKLAATLWEINGVGVSTLRPKDDMEKMSEGEFCRKEIGLKLLNSSKLPLQLSDPSHSPDSEEMERSKLGSHRRRASTSSHKLLQADYSLQNACLIEVDQAQKHRLKDLRHGLATSRELLRVLSRVCCIEEQQPTCVSLFLALKNELDRACVQVTNLIKEQKEDRGKKIEFLLKEQDRVRNSIAGDLESEKKMRKQTERLNKKLGRELAEANSNLSKTKKELESEKRAREILEQVCDELARGIGEDRAEVEELKRESEKVREEVEKEREMLQLADVLREERVQMKLSEAKYQFEEKTAALDELKNELENYLKSKRGGDSPDYERIRALERHLRETLPGSVQYRENEEQKEQGESSDSDNSDLHSIELNMDDISKSFEWGNAKPRKSTSMKAPRKSICLERQTSEGIVLEFSSGEKENIGLHNNGHSNPHFVQRECEDDEIERYNMIKDLRDHIVSASKTTEIDNAFAVLQGAD